ncbi:MAG: small-conductance mechanosensitive channel [Patiriisocius sp.]
METIKGIFQKPLFHIGEYSFHLYNLLLFVLTIFIVRALIKLFRVFINKTIKKRDWIDEEKAKTINRIGRFSLIILGLLASIWSLSLGPLYTEIMDFKVIRGEHPIVLRNVLLAVFVLFISIMVIRLTVILLKVSIRNHGTVDRGREFSIIRLYKYFAYIVAVIIALYLSGVNLRGLFIGSAALLVGIGFAIQHLFSDFFSGFILLFEDSFDVGDIIEMEDDLVMVKRIDLRTSLVMKRDGNLLTIPNRLLTDNKIVNWSQESPLTRFEVGVSVAYGSNLELVKSLLYQTALSHPDVNKSNQIMVFFDDFGDSGLQFSLLFWAEKKWDSRELLSDIRYAVDIKFRENKVEIPFPQRDINFRNVIKVEN